MIDLHCHILPGVDDGARTLEDSVAMARTAVADGILVVAATPHVRDDYPTSSQTIQQRLAEVQEVLRNLGVELEVRGGAEIAIDRLDQIDDDGLGRYGLGGNPSYLLLEFPYAGWPLALPSRVQALGARGVTAVLAHPERNAEVQAEPARLWPLLEEGALVQVTAASLDGRLGKGCRKAGLALIDRGLAHLIASDAHGPGVRETSMSAAAALVEDAALASWLTQEVPGAIVAGAPVPSRPPPRRRRRLRFL